MGVASAIGDAYAIGSALAMEQPQSCAYVSEALAAMRDDESGCYLGFYSHNYCETTPTKCAVRMKRALVPVSVSQVTRVSFWPCVGERLMVVPRSCIRFHDRIDAVEIRLAVRAVESRSKRPGSRWEFG